MSPKKFFTSVSISFSVLGFELSELDRCGTIMSSGQPTNLATASHLACFKVLGQRDDIAVQGNDGKVERFDFVLSIFKYAS